MKTKMMLLVGMMFFFCYCAEAQNITGRRNYATCESTVPTATPAMPKWSLRY